MKTKRFVVLLAFMILFPIFESCRHTSKENTWQEEQKTKWKSDCQQMLMKRGVSQKNAVDFCDCMLNKTSEKYTPDEAKKMTIDEERKLWEGCDYQW